MSSSPRRFSFILWVSIAVFVVVALLPWWRNHPYLRDLYDYGLVIASNGYLERGLHPYVDFTTPIQAGFLGLNWFFERLGGGTYGALTLGGAALIMVSGIALPALLARRWPWWAAALVGAAVTVSVASQHTILWHNSLGAVALALAIWSAACAPVWRRATWGWHVVTVAGLFLGGIDKLNTQLVALAVCLAWTVRAGWRREAGAGRIIASVAALVAAGVVLPVAAELAWTGASLRLWIANVVLLPFGARSGILREIFTGHFWVRPIHDYYGPLLLPQVGLVALWLVAWAAWACWPRGNPARGDRVFVPLAAFLALGAGAAVLATNYEIAPIGLGAWLVLAVSLWLGFAPARRGAVFALGLVVPACVLGGAAWWSAWLGQRSQFGYSGAPRATYVPATQAGPAFARLAGLKLPPEVVSTLAELERKLPEPDRSGRRSVFYGLGTEWLERFFPTPDEKGRPLWVHWGTTYGPADVARLRERLAQPDYYEAVICTVARDEWPDEIRSLLRTYLRDMIGLTIRRWRRDVLDLDDSVATLDLWGGNFDGHFLHFDHNPLYFRRVAERRFVLGVAREPGCVLLRAPTYHARGQAMIVRSPRDEGREPVYADFKVITHGAIPEEVRWRGRVELPAGQNVASLPFEFQALGKPVELWVMPGGEGNLFAGYREIELLHSVDSPGVPQVRPSAAAETPATPELAQALFGPLAWRPRQLALRGASVGADGLELAAGGELWFRTENMTGEIRGELRSTSPKQINVFAAWYKGGRFQVVQRGSVVQGRALPFHVWTAEPGGWIGFLTEPSPDGGAVTVHVDSLTFPP